MQAAATFIITTLVLVSNIVFVFSLLVIFFDRKVRAEAYRLADKHILALVFGISFSALLGSLVYSNIIGYPPCELCWIQRIFMYPQAVISALALWKRDKSIVGYLLPLTILGGLVAFYHSLTNWGFGTGLLACTATGGECARVYVDAYGYITIPFMAFSTFVYLFAVSMIYFKARKHVR
jgi:disulfide bond formation protein DsbB